jgi:hypothetical protein
MARSAGEAGGARSPLAVVLVIMKPLGVLLRRLVVLPVMRKGLELLVLELLVLELLALELLVGHLAVG